MSEAEQLGKIANRVFHPCAHQWTEVRYKVFANGTKHLCTQCLVCGAKTDGSAWVTQRGIDMAQVRPFDEGLCDAYQRRAAEERKVAAAADQRRRHLEREQYIRNSPEWWSIRERVMRRDNHWCQACFEKPATEVHHTTYAHLYAEILWELRAVCRECHERIHGLIE